MLLLPILLGKPGSMFSLPVQAAFLNFFEVDFLKWLPKVRILPKAKEDTKNHVLIIHLSFKENIQDDNKEEFLNCIVSKNFFQACIFSLQRKYFNVAVQA